MRGSRGGTSAACASNGTTASCRVRLGGRAGRRTWVGRRRTARRLAMGLLGNGLSQTNQNEDALSVREALLATQLRLGAPEEDVFVTQSNLASTYRELGLVEKASNMLRNVYSGRVRLKGEEDQETIIAALNYASSLGQLRRFEEAKSLLRKIIRVTPRILGETHEITLRMRWIYANVLYMDTSATPDDLREAVTKLEDTARTAQRVFGRAHPMVALAHRLSRRVDGARGGTECESNLRPWPPSRRGAP